MTIFCFCLQIQSRVKFKGKSIKTNYLIVNEHLMDRFVLLDFLFFFAPLNIKIKRISHRLDGLDIRNLSRPQIKFRFQIVRLTAWLNAVFESKIHRPKFNKHLCLSYLITTLLPATIKLCNDNATHLLPYRCLPIAFALQSWCGFTTFETLQCADTIFSPFHALSFALRYVRWFDLIEFISLCFYIMEVPLRFGICCSTIWYQKNSLDYEEEIWFFASFAALGELISLYQVAALKQLFTIQRRSVLCVLHSACTKCLWYNACLVKVVCLFIIQSSTLVCIFFALCLHISDRNDG